MSKHKGQYIYLVIKDGKVKSYDTASAAYHAAEQNGGTPFAHWFGGWELDRSEITLSSLKRKYR